MSDEERKAEVTEKATEENAKNPKIPETPVDNAGNVPEQHTELQDEQIKKDGNAVDNPEQVAKGENSGA